LADAATAQRTQLGFDQRHWWLGSKGWGAKRLRSFLRFTTLRMQRETAGAS
jgi:hypothetical protein